MELGFFAQRSGGRDNRIPPPQRPPFHHHRRSPSSPARFRPLPRQAPPPPPYRIPVQDARLLPPHSPAPPPSLPPPDPWTRISFLDYGHRIDAAPPPSQYSSSSLGRLTRTQVLEWESPAQQLLSLPYMSAPYPRLLEASSYRPQNAYDGGQSRHGIAREQHPPFLVCDGREDLQSGEFYRSLPSLELANSRRSAALSARAFLDEATPEKSFVSRKVHRDGASTLKTFEKEETIQQSRLKNKSPTVVEAFGPHKRSREEELNVEGGLPSRKRLFQESNLHTLQKIDRSLQHLRHPQETFENEQLFQDTIAEAGQVVPSEANLPPFCRSGLDATVHPPLPPSKDLRREMQQFVQTSMLDLGKADRKSSLRGGKSCHSLSGNMKHGIVLVNSVQSKKPCRRPRKKKGMQYGNGFLKATFKQPFSFSAQQTGAESKARPKPCCHDGEEHSAVIKRLKKSPGDVREELLTSRSPDKGHHSPTIKIRGRVSNQKEIKPCSGPNVEHFTQSLRLQGNASDVDNIKHPIQLKIKSESVTGDRVNTDLCSNQVPHSVVVSQNSSPFGQKQQDSMGAETLQNSSFTKGHQQSSDPRIKVTCANIVEASLSGSAGNLVTMQAETLHRGKQSFSVLENLLPSSNEHLSPACLKSSNQDNYMKSSSPIMDFSLNRVIAHKFPVEGLSQTMERDVQLTTPVSAEIVSSGGGSMTTCSVLKGTENCPVDMQIMAICSNHIGAAEALDAPPVAKLEGILYKHSRKGKALKKQKSDVRGEKSSAVVVFPSKRLTQSAAPSLHDAPVLAAAVRGVKLDISESHKSLGNDEKSTQPAVQQPVQATEGEVRLFGKTLKATISELKQQHEDVPKADLQDEVMNPLSELVQPVHISKMENLSSSSTMSNLFTTSPLNLSSQQSNDVVLDPSASSMVKKGPVLQSNVKQLIHQFRRHVQANTTLHSRKLPSVVAQHQYRLGAILTSTRHAAHTWRRNSNVGSSAGLTTMPKIASSGMSNEGSHLADKHGTVQVAAYVRKGNSLVRTHVSSSLSAVLRSGVAGKETAGKLLHTHQGLQRGLLQQRSFKKSAVPLKVCVAQSTHAAHSAAIPTMIEKSTTMTCTTNNVTFPDSVAQMPLHAVIPFISTTDANITHSSRSLDLMGQDVNCSGSSKNLSVTENAPNSLNVHMPLSSGLNLNAGSMTAAVTEIKNVTSTVSEMKNETSERMDSQALYIKSKMNKLVTALPPDSQGLSIKVSSTAVPSSGSIVKDHYYKTKVNQLIRDSIHVKASTSGPVQCSSGGFQDAWEVRKEAILQTKLGRVLRKKHAGRCSWVWTLKGTKFENIHATASQSKGVAPVLFPWKRPGFRSFAGATKLKVLPKAEKGSLLFLIRKKLQSLRKVQPVYTLSAHGYSLRRSGVLSLGGASLKWTKSIEKRSKKASEEATKAVAAVEKEKREEKESEVGAGAAVAKAKAGKRAARRAARRERIILVGLVRYKMDPSKRTLLRLPDIGSLDDNNASAGTETVEGAKISTPRRLSISGTEYVRLGNGNQLVRSPKATTRALASEKVRWSLHTIRSRHAKKQQYCQFFTRFGRCNKTKGKCLYIHDPEKVAVCTKFLKGCCTGTNCLLTHKVIPERMPDCSYFLQGLCINEKCPYRHVNVNPNAPSCEGFLKGYCAAGDECKKKHTHICTSYAATGVCQDQPLCKLHHPKKKDKVTPRPVTSKSGYKLKRRYFTEAVLNSCESTCLVEKNHNVQPTSKASESLEEYISLPDIEMNADEDSDFIQNLTAVRPQVNFLNGDSLADDFDTWIKPMRLLHKPLDIVPPKKFAA